MPDHSANPAGDWVCPRGTDGCLRYSKCMWCVSPKPAPVVEPQQPTYPTHKQRAVVCAYEDQTCDVCIDCQNQFVGFGAAEREQRIIAIIEAERDMWMKEPNRWASHLNASAYLLSAIKEHR